MNAILTIILPNQPMHDKTMNIVENSDLERIRNEI
jgi:hypothetical protein